MTSEIRYRLALKVGSLASVYVLSALVFHFTPSDIGVWAATISVICGFLMPLLVPKAVISAIEETLDENGQEAAVKLARTSVLVGLLLLPLVFFLEHLLLLLMIGVTGGTLAIAAAYQWAVFHRLKGTRPTATAPPPTPRPGTTTASALPQARKVEELSHGGFYEQFLLFSPCSKMVATWTPQETRLFKLGQSAPVGSLAGSRVPVAFSRDSRQLFTTGNDALESWDTDDISPRSKREELSDGEQAEDGSWQAAHWQGGRIQVLNSSQGYVVPFQPTNWDLWLPYGTCYCPARDLLVCAYGQACAVLEAGTRKLVWQSPSVGRDVTAVAVSADGDCAVFGSMGGSVFVLDLRQNDLVGRLSVPGEIRCIAFAPDSRHVAVGCGDLLSDVILLNVSSGPVALARPGYSNTWSVGFSPDGRLMAAGCDDGKLSLWEWQ